MSRPSVHYGPEVRKHCESRHVSQAVDVFFMYQVRIMRNLLICLKDWVTMRVLVAQDLLPQKRYRSCTQLARALCGGWMRVAGISNLYVTMCTVRSQIAQDLMMAL